MAGIYKGKVGFNWLSTTGVSSLTGSFALQSRDVKRSGDTFEGKDANGEVIGVAHYNKYQTLTIDYLVTGASLNGSASVEMPDKGDTLVVGDAAFGQIAGSWDVRGSNAKSTNAGGLIVTVDGWRNVNVP